MEAGVDGVVKAEEPGWRERAKLSRVMETNKWRGGWRNFKMTEGRRARDLGKEEKEGGDIWA